MCGVSDGPPRTPQVLLTYNTNNKMSEVCAPARAHTPPLGLTARAHRPSPHSRTPRTPDLRAPLALAPRPRLAGGAFWLAQHRARRSARGHTPPSSARTRARARSPRTTLTPLPSRPAPRSPAPRATTTANGALYAASAMGAHQAAAKRDRTAACTMHLVMPIAQRARATVTSRRSV